MKYFYTYVNTSITGEYEKLLPLSLLENADVFIYTKLAFNAPKPNAPIVIGSFYENPLPNMPIAERKALVWETLNEYVYELVNEKCQEHGYRDYKDVVDSATNTFLPQSEQSEAQGLRDWWGRVWTQAYVIRDTILIATSESQLQKIKVYIDQLKTVV